MEITPIWAGETAVILGTGPSLTPEDVARVRGRARVIAVNDAYRLAPWADALYASDARWWAWHGGVPSFSGQKIALARTAYPAVGVLRNTGESGLETDRRDGVRTGKNSVYQAMGVAVHCGVTRIVLLGVDMMCAPDRRSHFFGEHRNKTRPPFDRCLDLFETIAAPLVAAGVSVVNCTRRTALRAFPCQTLESVFPAQEAVA
jgi:hypothetical protein